MIHRDYLMRLFERLGRELAIITGLRKRDAGEEALIYIDDLMRSQFGISSPMLNALPIETIIQTLTPLGRPNVEAYIWAGFLLHAEGIIYEKQGKESESFHRYVKALLLLIEVLRYEPVEEDAPITATIKELLQKLENYELSPMLLEKMCWYYEHIGQYARAEDTLFDLLENTDFAPQYRTYGIELYQRLLKKSDDELDTGSLPRVEIEEGLKELESYQ